jgi:hypothetical protein
MDGKIDDMSEEELRARVDAATLGRLQIMQDAIEALIAVSPNPERIRFRLIQSLAAMQNGKVEDTALSWVPDAIVAGANPLAKRFIDACSTNPAIQH